jgi:hypothetical protein
MTAMPRTLDPTRADRRAALDQNSSLADRALNGSFRQNQPFALRETICQQCAS